MELEELIDDICADLQSESDLAQDCAGSNNTGLYIYHEGVCDGLRRALRYVEIRLTMKKAAMPASTAADPQKETNNDK